MAIPSRRRPCVVVLWPPIDGNSRGDEPAAVEARDAVVREYDAFLAQGDGRDDAWS